MRNIIQFNNENIEKLPEIFAEGLVRCLDGYDSNLPSIILIIDPKGLFDAPLIYIVHLSYMAGRYALVTLKSQEIFDLACLGENFAAALDEAVEKIKDYAAAHLEADSKERLGLSVRMILENNNAKIPA